MKSIVRRGDDDQKVLARKTALADLCDRISLKSLMSNAR